mgnify:CR=1 FL=1
MNFGANRLSNGKRKKFLAKAHWPESGQESGQKLAGLKAGLPEKNWKPGQLLTGRYPARQSGRNLGRIAGRIGWNFWKKIELLTGQYPAKNPAANPARFRPDSDVSCTIHFGFDFHFFYFVFSDLFARNGMFRNVIERR